MNVLDFSEHVARNPTGPSLASRMLKKHALSIAEGSASFVLAALGGSTYRTEYAFASPAFAEAASRLRAEALHRASRAGRSLAAAALDGLFDHPAGCSDAVPDLLECCVPLCQKGFSTTG